MLICGDSIEILKTLEPNSVDAIVTDPPYGLSFMGKKWDYSVPSVELWREAIRVLKPGGHLLSFGGTRTYHRMVVNIEDAGFEIRDQLQWIYGSGFPKSHNLEDEWEGWGTALKPANEPIVLARKPLEKGLTVAQNVQKYGTGALNIDAGRIAGEYKNQGGGSFATGKFANSHKSNTDKDGLLKIEETQTQGRWPANVLFDEDAAKTLDEQSGVSKSKAAIRRNKSGMGIHDSEKTTFGKGDVFGGFDDSGGASRFFYVAKASKRERGEGNIHPTVKPLKLMEYLVRMITPPKGTVLDPFTGSGTTGVACKNLGFNFIGIEMNEEYVNIAKRRIG